LSGLALAGRPSLASRARRVSAGAAGPGWLRAFGAGAHGGPRRERKRVVGAPRVLKTGGHRLAPGRPHGRMRAVLCSISGGTRRSPHHRCPQAAHGSVDCQRAPSCCVRWDRRATLTARRASGAVTSSWAIRVRASASGPGLRGRSGRKAQGRSEAARSTLGSTATTRGHGAATRPLGGDSHANGPRRTAPRSA